MRAALLLALLAGCELDVTPAKPTPTAPLPAPPLAPPHATLHVDHVEVVVREYFTDAAISNAKIEYIEYVPCTSDLGNCVEAQHSVTTDSAGIAHIQPTTPTWSLERVRAPGYLTDCPAPADDDSRHRLVVDRTRESDARYICYLVPPTAMFVRDRDRAIQIASTEPDTAAWLTNHGDARPTQITLVGIRWEVWFETSTAPGARLVTVDGIDESAFVDRR